MNPKLTLISKMPSTEAQKVTQTVLDTIVITPEIARSWSSPPFQRPLKLNNKVMELAQEIKKSEIVPGVLTLGALDGQTYLLDGQHRREAFLMAEIEAGYADVRKHVFRTLAEMGEEFVRLNSSLVRLRPDDVLRGLEASSEALRNIRKACPFVGYDMIRRGERSPIVSMSAVLRCWFGSETEVPSTSGMSATTLATQITTDDAGAITEFLTLAIKAWGRDPEYARLWGSLNLGLCMWLYRRTVVAQYSPRSPKLTREIFTKLLMALSADSNYLDWLSGRQMRDVDRSPAYSRIKSLFARRLEDDTGKKSAFPSPAWSGHSGTHGRKR